MSGLGDLSVLSGLMKGGGGKGMAALIPVVSGLLANGGLNKILAGFHAQGLGAQADSWVSTGPNQPVSAEDVRRVLGEDQLAHIASQLGVSHDEAAAAVAEALPQVVDSVSPKGKLPAEKQLDHAFAQVAAPAKA